MPSRPASSLHPAGSIVEDLRAVKSPDEIALIRRSVQANSEAYAQVLRRVRPGQSELEIAAELEFQMRALGCGETGLRHHRGGRATLRAAPRPSDGAPSGRQ